jgi:peptidyl-prolyl cis-trans isomerase C
MNNCVRAALLAVTLVAAACVKNEPPGAAKQAAAVVNGKPIGNELFEAYAASTTRKPFAELTPEQRDQALEQLVSLQLAADVAQKAQLDQSAEVATQMALLRLNVLANAEFKHYDSEHPVTDGELKAEYDTRVAKMGTQYRARHILVESKALADLMIERLNSGVDFALLAQRESKDGSAKQGGDLGWFDLQTMVKPFAAALAGLEKGKYTKQPVQTEYGYHVIKLEDLRAPTPPGYDDVKERLKAEVQRKKVHAYMDELRKVAKVEKLAVTPTAVSPAVPPTEAPTAVKPN